MYRTVVGLLAGWFLYTKTGRHTAKNIYRNALPMLEKELGVSIIKPIKELIKDKKDV